MPSDMPGGQAAECQLTPVLEKDLAGNADVLRALTREMPVLLAAESLEPLSALLVFAPRRPQMPHTAFLWGRKPSSCRRLLGALTSGATYWLSAADPEAASAVRQWTSEVTWDAEETNYTVAPESFRPAPHPEVRRLTAADGAVLAGPRPHVARALSVPAPAPPLTEGAQGPAPERKPANCVFGVIRSGTWCGDAFCLYLYKDVWTIADVAVAERCRRIGLGKGLVTACTEYVLANGGLPTYQAYAANEPSRRTCEGLGYVPVGRRFRFELTAP